MLRPVLKRTLVVFLILFVVLPVSAQVVEPQQEITSRDITLNAFLPGTAQIKMGDLRAGVLYLTAVPMNLVGTTLQLIYLSRVWGDPNLERYVTDEDGRIYLYYLHDLNRRPDKWLYFSGTVMGLYGSLLSAHSQYDLTHRLSERQFASQPRRLSFGEVVAAPWQPRNLFNLEILPVFALSLLPNINQIRISDVTGYFSRESVTFLGREISPAAGLALAGGSAILIANANAVWEEISYRGASLNAYGITGSAVRFGLAHLPNALSPNASIQDTVWQSIFATMFGLYADVVTENNDGDFRKAIAWHFWNNVVAFTMSYMGNPDDHPFFRIHLDMTY